MSVRLARLCYQLRVCAVFCHLTLEYRGRWLAKHFLKDLLSEQGCGITRCRLRTGGEADGLVFSTSCPLPASCNAQPRSSKDVGCQFVAAGKRSRSRMVGKPYAVCQESGEQWFVSS